jgi:hypothetical protein
MLEVALAIADVGAGAGGAIAVVLVVRRAVVIVGLVVALAIVNIVLGWCQRPFSAGAPPISNMLADAGIN